MISFHNPKFHEKIMKKYGRKIRRSYFPNLFFMQNSKSSGSVKRHISVRINLNFHNTLFRKNYPLSSPKEKQQGNPVIPFKLSYPDLKKPDLTHEKPVSFNLKPGSPEPGNLTPQLIDPELTTHNLTFLKLINLKLTTYNLNPANPTFTNPTSLKLTFSGKNSREPISEKGRKIQNPWSYKNFFLSGNSSFFIYSNPHSVPEISSQKTHSDTNSPGKSLLTVLAESGLSRKIHNEALRKINELNLSGQDFLFGGVFPAKKISSGTTGPGISAEIEETAIWPFSPEHLNRISPVRKTKAENSRIRKYTGPERSNIPGQGFREAGFKRLSLKTLEQEKSGKEKSVQKESKLEKWIREELSQNKLSERTIQIRTNRTEVQKEIQKDVNRQLIREKQNLRETKEKQDLREIRKKQSLKEIIDYGEVPKTSSSNPVQFLIRNFLERTSLFPYQGYSTDPESSISHNIIPEQKTALFPFSKKGCMQMLPAGGIFSAKGTVSEKTIQGRFSKDLIILRKSLLQEDMPGVPGLYTRISSKLFTSIGSPLLITKNVIQGAGAASHKSASTTEVHKRSTGYNRSERIFPECPGNIFRQYPQPRTERGTGFFEKNLPSSIKTQTGNQQLVLELNSYFNKEPESPGFKANRAFNWLTVFTQNITAASQLNQEATRIPGGKVAFQLNQQVTHPPNNKTAFQPDRQEIHKFGNAVFSPGNQPAIKTANKALIHVFNRLGNLLAINKLIYTTGTYTINSPAAIAREKKHLYRQTSNRRSWLQNTFKLKAVSIPASTSMMEGWDTSYLPEMPVLLACNNSIATYTTGQLAVQVPTGIKARIFNSLMALTTNYSTKNYLATNYPKTNYPTTNYLTPDYYKANNQKELKREQQYPLPITRLQTIFNQSAFLKPLITVAYKFKHPETLLPGGTKNFTSNKTAAPKSGRKETSALTSSEKYTPCIAPIYTLMQPVARAFNYVEKLTQSYPAFMAVNYTVNYPFNDSAARTNDLRIAAINYPIKHNYTQGAARHPFKLSNNYHSEILKPHNPVQADRLSSSRLFSSRLTSSSPSRLASSGQAPTGLSSSQLFNSSAFLLSRTGNKNPGQKAVPVSLWRNKSPDIYPGIRKLKQISSSLILSARPKNILGKAWTGLLSAPSLQKISEGREDISKGLLFGFKGLPGSGKTVKSPPYPGPGSTNFTFSGVGRAGKNPGTAGFGASEKEGSELMHAGGSIHKNGRQELVYGKQETLQEEVKQIKKVVFETKAAVADHFESHLTPAVGKAGQQVDIEDISEKIMQSINRRLKIEAERRGIF